MQHKKEENPFRVLCGHAVVKDTNRNKEALDIEFASVLYLLDFWPNYVSQHTSLLLFQGEYCIGNWNRGNQRGTYMQLFQSFFQGSEDPYDKERIKGSNR